MLNPGSPQSTGISGTIGVFLDSTAGTVAVRFNDEPTVVAAGKQGTTTRHLITNTEGAIKVYDLVNGTVTVNGTITGITNSIAVHVLSTGGTLGVRAGQIDGSVAVYFDPSNPAVNIGTPTISGITNSISVHLLSTGGTIGARVGQVDGSVAVYFSPGTPAVSIGTPTITGITNSVAVHLLSTAGTIAARVGQVDGSVAVYFSQSNPAVNVGTPTITGITNSIAVHLLSTAGTIGARVGQVDGTVAVFFSPATPSVKMISASAGTSNVAGTTTSTTLLSANAARKGATVFNNSTATLYVQFGTIASSSNFAVAMSANDYFEVPFGYTGRIDGIFAAANGAARITELT